MSVTARYFRWTITRRRSSSNEYVQASRFHLVRNGGTLGWPSATVVTNPGGSNPGGEGPENLVDDDTGTKWLDENFGEEQTGTAVLVFDAGEEGPFDAYRYWTGNDNPERDPISWTLEASTDGSSWTQVDSRSWESPTTDRQALAGTWSIQVSDEDDDYEDAILADNPVAFWRFSETSGSIATDSSNNDSYAEAVGSPSLSSSGWQGSGVSAYSGNHFRVPASRLSEWDFSGDFSIEGATLVQSWHFDFDNPRFLGIMGRGDSSFSGEWILYGVMEQNRIELGAEGKFAHSGDDFFRINDWTYWAITYERSAQTLRFYKDGQLESTWTDYDISSLSTSEELTLGRGNGFRDTWKPLDELAVYNYRLTDEQVQTHFTQEEPPVPTVNARAHLHGESRFSAPEWTDRTVFDELVGSGYRDIGLEPDTWYRYRLQAIELDGEGAVVSVSEATDWSLVKTLATVALPEIATSGHRAILFDAEGVIISVLEGFDEMRWTRNLWQQGELEMTFSMPVSDEHIPVDVLQTLRTIAVNDPFTNRIDFAYTVRRIERTISDDIETVRLRAVEYGDFDRATTLPPPFDASTQESAYHETYGDEHSMKDIVRKNVGVDAPVPRRLSRLFIEPDQERGDETRRWRTRFHVLEDRLEQMGKTSGLGWEVTYNPVSRLFSFEVIEERYRDNIIFDVGLDTAFSISYTDNIHAHRNVVYVGGGGEGVERELAMFYDDEEWPDGEPQQPERAEIFRDARDDDGETDGELEGRAEEVLADRLPVSNVTATVNPSGSFRYRADWDLGDIVLVRERRWEVERPHRIVEVEQSITPDSGIATMNLIFDKPRAKVTREIQKMHDRTLDAGRA